MPINFFESELKKIRKLFNEVFSSQMIFDKQLQNRMVLSICWLGQLNDQIIEAEDKRKAKGLIREFVKVRDVIKSYLYDMKTSNSKEVKNNVERTNTRKTEQHPKVI